MFPTHLFTSNCSKTLIHDSNRITCSWLNRFYVCSEIVWLIKNSPSSLNHWNAPENDSTSSFVLYTFNGKANNGFSFSHPCSQQLHFISISRSLSHRLFTWNHQNSVIDCSKCPLWQWKMPKYSLILSLNKWQNFSCKNCPYFVRVITTLCRINHKFFSTWQTRAY